MTKLAPPPNHWRSRMIRVARIVTLSYLGLVGLLMFLEESLIFFPSRFPAGQWQPHGVDLANVEFTSGDGTTLHAWHLTHPDPQVRLLYCHGNAGNLSDRVWTVKMLRDELQAEVFIFDYRGYGRSEGSPNGKGVLLDGRAAIETFAERAGVDPKEIIPLGRSLGGAVAVDVAVHFSTKAVVLESTFSSMVDVAEFHYPFIPVRWLMRTRLNSVDKIRDYYGRLLQSHGDVDEVVPIQFGQRLFDAAPGPKKFITTVGCTHNDPPSADYYRALQGFVRDAG